MTNPSLLVRVWRRVFPGRNPLIRLSDRVEAALLVCSVMIVLGGLPIAAALGSETYASEKQASLEQLATRHPATAILLADGPSIKVASNGAAFFRPAPTEAKWTLADGTSRQGTVMVGQGKNKGSTVGIWLDEQGNPVPAPQTGTGALVNSVAISLGLWLALGFGLTGICWLTRAFLNRLRYAQWQREWIGIEGRQTHP